MIDNSRYYLLALVCAVLLDFLLLWIFRKKYSQRYQGFKDRLFTRFPFLARLDRSVRNLFLKFSLRSNTQQLSILHWPRLGDSARRWIAVTPEVLLPIAAGLVLLCAGQLQRQQWWTHNATSLVVLGVGLLLLSRGLIALGLMRAGDTSEAADPRDASPAAPLAWVQPGWALLGTGLLLAAVTLRNGYWQGLSTAWLAPSVSMIAIGVWSIGRGIPGWLARFFAFFAKFFDLTADRTIFLFAGIALSAYATRAASFFPIMLDPVTAVCAWIGGILLVVMGAWRPARLPRIEWRPIAIGSGLALLSLPLRTIGAASLPLGLTGDEGNVGLQAVEFLKGNINNIFITGWFSFPTLYFFIQSRFIALFGQTAEALRYSSAFAGALEIAVTYWVARLIFDRRVALLAGLFMVVFHFHIHFSRIGLNNVWDALFFTWVLGAFWYGWERRSRGAFVLAGLGLGLGLYFYVSTRLLFLLLPILALVFAWVRRRRLAAYLPHLLITLLVALVVVLPLAWYFAHSPNNFIAPMERVKIMGAWLVNEKTMSGKTGLRVLFDQFIKSLQAYTDTPTFDLYAPGTSLLLTIPAVLFWISAAVFLTRWRDNRFWLLAGWLGTLAAAGALSVGTPAGHRYIAAAPALAIIVGLGLATILSLVKAVFRGPRWLSSIVVAGLLVFAGTQEIRLLYRYDSSVEFGGYANMTAQSLAEILQHEPPGTRVYYLNGPGMGYESIPSLPYLVPGATGVDMPEPWSPGKVDRSAWNILFVIDSHREAEIQAIQLEYPLGQLSAISAPDGYRLYWLYDPAPPFPYPTHMVLPATSLGLPYSFLRGSPAR